MDVCAAMGEMTMNRQKTAHALLRLAKELVSEDKREPEPGSTLDLLERMAKDDSAAMKKGDFRVARRMNADALAIIGDAFARFCIGDRKAALRQLESFVKKPFEGNLNPFIDSGEYPQLFDNLSMDLTRAIKKHLPV